MKVEKVSISKIELNSTNPRIIKDYKFSKLVKSIREFPQMLELRPIVVNNENVILGGNMRYKALQELKEPVANVKIVYDITDEQKKEFIIKDNLPFGDWDWDSLDEWDSDELEDWGMEIESQSIDKITIDEDEENQDIRFTTKVNLIRSNLANNIKTKENINIISAYKKAEDIIIKELNNNERITY